MKTRNGFVSNSSSSSFAIIAERETFLKVLKSMDPLPRAYVETLGWEEDKICDLVVVKFEHVTGSDNSTEWNFDNQGMLDKAKEFGYNPAIEGFVPELDDELEWVREGDDWMDAPRDAEQAMWDSEELKGKSVTVTQDL